MNRILIVLLYGFCALSQAQTLSYISGNGQIVNHSFSQPLVVKYADSGGKPIADATITWNITPTFGHLNSPSQLTSKTNADGLALIGLADPNPLQLVEQSQIVATAPAGKSVTFWITSALPSFSEQTLQDDGTFGPLNPKLVPDRVINATAGSLIQGAFRVAVGAGDGQPIPNVSMLVTTVQPVELGPGSATLTVVPPNSPGASCAGEPVSNARGLITCDLQVGNNTGSTPLYFVIGNAGVRPVVKLNITVGPPAKVLATGGDSQSGAAGAALPAPLTVRVTDLGGNGIGNVPITWSVTQGSATLSAASTSTDAKGASGVNVTLGAAPGLVKVRAAVSSLLTAVFNESVNVAPIATVSVVSGDQQTAAAGSAFAQPLLVAVQDAAGNPLGNVPVAFAVAGDDTLSAASVNTASDGTASVTLTAGAATGAVTVTATAGGVTAVFQSLTVTSRDPILTVSSFVNAASLQAGLPSCGLGAVRGTNLVPGVTGTMSAQLADDGTYPISLGPIQSISVGGFAAPIISVSNIIDAGVVVFQTPCEAPAGPVTIVVYVQDASVSVDGVPVLASQPGLFEAAASDGKSYAVAWRADGTAIGPENAAAPGETIRVLATGLGAAMPSIVTNQPGIVSTDGRGGQAVLASLIAGVNDTGVVVAGAWYATNQIGAYWVEIQIPLDTVTGPYQPVVLAIPVDGGDLTFSNTVYIPIAERPRD